ncbi:hypothetical protein ACP70R_050301 [Stipagrostis hirtigluma subsp. patula]
MAEPLDICVFYGNGEIGSGANGVELRNFETFVVRHPNPEGKRLTDFKVSLLRHLFHLDPKVYNVTVNGLWSRTANPMIWEMKELQGTAHWHKWIGWIRRRGAQAVVLAQPCPREGREGSVAEESSTSGAVADDSLRVDEVEMQEHVIPDADEVPPNQSQPEGQADEGELFDAVVDLLELDNNHAIYEENALNESIMNEEEDEEEDDADAVDNIPTPDEWRRTDNLGMEVAENKNCNFQYGSCVIQPGQTFSTKGELQVDYSREIETEASAMLQRM